MSGLLCSLNEQMYAAVTIFMHMCIQSLQSRLLQAVNLGLALLALHVKSSSEPTCGAQKRAAKHELAPIASSLLTHFLKSHRSPSSQGFEHRGLKNWAPSEHGTFLNTVIDLSARATPLTQLLT